MTRVFESTTIHELLEGHPFLVEFLAEYDPNFRLLKNPMMRNTVARAATVKKAATMAGLEVGELIAAIEERIRQEEGGAVPEGEATKAEDPDGGDPVQGGPRTDKVAQLKGLIRDLHDGVSPEEAKARFDSVVRDVTATEIGEMEEQLIREGLPVQEIQRLCDLHVSVVRDGLSDAEEMPVAPGHPVHTYRKENEVITEIANSLGALCSEAGREGKSDQEWRSEVLGALEQISGIDNHYLRKENELFPVLERHGVTGPSQVMWGVHDEIRAQVKSTRTIAEEGPAEEVATAGAALARAVVEMVYKEEKILLPMAQQTLTHEEWKAIRDGEDELGYVFFRPTEDFPYVPPTGGPKPRPMPAELHPDTGAGGVMGLPIVSPEPPAPLPDASEQAYVDLGTGRLSIEQVDMMLRHLPIEISFVDAEGFVRYYSDTEERLFPRTPGAIGRHVKNCHPPKSVHMVEEILRKFASGERDVAEFWIEMQCKFIHIRYFAVRNPEKTYLGCLEVTQDVTGIRALEGQRRLLEWS